MNCKETIIKREIIKEFIYGKRPEARKFSTSMTIIEDNTINLRTELFEKMGIIINTSQVVDVAIELLLQEVSKMVSFDTKIDPLYDMTRRMAPKRYLERKSDGKKNI